MYRAMKHIVTGKDVSSENLSEILSGAREDKFIATFVSKNRAITESDVPKKIDVDVSLQYILSSLDDATHVKNVLTQRLRTMLSLSWPKQTKNASIEQLHMLATSPPQTETMGIKSSPEALSVIKALSISLKNIERVTDQAREAVERVSTRVMPSVSALLGPMLASRIVAEAGSLAKLARMPASTIQVLGARRAVLRHISSGTKNPKYGLLFMHKYVRKAKDAGRRARVLADKIAICARVDFFKGEPIGEKIRKELMDE